MTSEWGSPTTTIVEATFEFADGVEAEFGDTIEVSLDCPVCLRTGRTIGFHDIAGTARCSPTGHPFPGVAESRTVSFDAGRTTVAYRLRHATAEFTDPKYHYLSVRHPTWARIYFHLQCPDCGQRQRDSVQNNIVRPFMVRCKQCSRDLCEHRVEMPLFRSVDSASGRVLYRHDGELHQLWLPSIERISADAMQALATATGLPGDEINRRRASGVSAYELRGWESRLTDFWQPWTHAIELLIQDGVNFSWLHNGRRMNEMYAWRLSQKQSGKS